MITPEEKKEIIDLAVEKALLMLPEVVGNLMTQHATLVKMNSQFYKDHPEFAGHKSVVASVMEKVDGQDTLAKYEDKLKTAIPEIKSRIALLGTLDMKTVSSNPDRNFNGVI
jgi:hypothetical protein